MVTKRWSQKSSKKKAGQLGMPLGTARGKLVKILLFSMAKELGRDACFHCNQKIETVNEFSLEHKKPWLDVSTDLFWDLSNVAFSHLHCNASKARRDSEILLANLSKRKDHSRSAPEGMAWCMGHEAYLPRASFSRHLGRSSGLQKYCVVCRKERRSPPHAGVVQRQDSSLVRMGQGFES